jgi:Zn-dependent protease/CBS domain-containing protein
MNSLAAPPRRKAAAPAALPASGVSLGRILGVEIRASPSLLVIAALIVASLAVEFSQTHPSAAPLQAWSAAVLAGVLFFGSILAHEFAHSLVARLRGIGVHGITLFIFGGVSRMKEEPRKASDEVLISVVGPLASAAIGAACLGLARFLPAGSLPADAAGWLGRVNLSLALFNLLPGFPLDGGRVFRAAVWGQTGDLRKATRWAAAGGVVVAQGLILTGAVLLFGFARLDGIWLGLIGMFLLSAVQASLLQSKLLEALEWMPAARAMRTELVYVPPEERLSDLVTGRVLASGEDCFVVADAGLPLGILTDERIASIPADRWPRLSAAEAMVPLEELPSVGPSASLKEALQALEASGSAWAAVRDEDRLAGLLCRDDLLRWARLRMRFGGGPRSPALGPSRSE